MEVAKGFTDVLYTTMVLLFNEIFVPVMTEILSLFYEKAMYVPVSYTHLDVYKRQAEGDRLPGSLAVHDAHLTALLMNLLDVYKRQGLSSGQRAYPRQSCF